MTQVTALHIAAMVGRSKGLVKLLLEYGADPYKETSKGELPLHLAVQSDNVQFEIEKAILDQKLDRKAASRYTPKFFTTKTRICEHGIQEVSKTTMPLKGMSSATIEYSSEGCRHAIVQLLSAQDPKTIQARTLKGDTPLHIATRNISSIERLTKSAKLIISALITAGAEVEISNQVGQTPLSLASTEIKALMETQQRIKNTALQAIANQKNVSKTLPNDTPATLTLRN